MNSIPEAKADLAAAPVTASHDYWKRRALKAEDKQQKASRKVEAQQQEIERLTTWVNDLQSGMFINCVYCGHRYGPDHETPVAMADVLKEHIRQCRHHPLAAAERIAEKRRVALVKLRPIAHAAYHVLEGSEERDDVYIAQASDARKLNDAIDELTGGDEDIHPALQEIDRLIAAQPTGRQAEVGKTFSVDAFEDVNAGLQKLLNERGDNDGE